MKMEGAATSTAAPVGGGAQRQEGEDEEMVQAGGNGDLTVEDDPLQVRGAVCVCVRACARTRVCALRVCFEWGEDWEMGQAGERIVCALCVCVCVC